MTAAYTIRKDHEDRWAVIDPKTDEPIEIDDIVQDKLSEQDARVVVELLNSGNAGDAVTSPDAAIAIEFARRAIFSDERPTSAELDKAFAELKGK